MANKIVEYKGAKYTWTGKSWYENKTFTRPCKMLIMALNRELSGHLAAVDLQCSDPYQLIRSASQARDACQYDRAEKLTRKALKLQPGNLAAVTVLSSIYRAWGKPQQAIDITEPYRGARSTPLLTTRAAALCDLGRWVEAKKTISRAIAISDSGEALNVRSRIKAECPDLY